jgi:uncharacterized protein YjiS (DUF1127 family)
MTTQTVGGGIEITSSRAPASFVRRVGRAVRDYLRYQRTMSELDALSTRELADIGLTRGEIDGVARQCSRDRS